jgi:thiamine monophosphate synthase
MAYGFYGQKSMAYAAFVNLIVETTAICGKKPKIVFINSKIDIAVDKKMF